LWQGDCDGDDDCQEGLVCFDESGPDTVPGCTSTRFKGKDYCYVPQEPIAAPSDVSANSTVLAIVGDEDKPAAAFPLGLCQGDCDGDDDCQEGLVCFDESGPDTVPGCTGTRFKGKDYCYVPQEPVYLAPFVTPYIPGKATFRENGLHLSEGLTARVIAKRGNKVQLDTGGTSNLRFHALPDGAAVFTDEESGGWIYVSNSESVTDGGVGAITFDSQG
jgi:hypothetical protein